MSYPPSIILFIIAAVLLIGLLSFSKPYRVTITGRAFYGLCICVLIWVVGFIFETLAPALQQKIFFANLQFAGLCFLPYTWIYLVFNYREIKVPKMMWYLLALLPVLTNIVIWTDPLHHWFRGKPYIDTTLASFPVLVNDYHFWFYLIHAPGGYIYFLIAIIALIYGLEKMQPVYQKQAIILLSAAILPLASDILYVLGYSPIPNYNLTPAVFSASAFLIAWGLFRYQWLELRPMAKQTVFENLRDGVLVLDAKNRIVDFNPAAEKIVNLTAEVIGKTPGEIRVELLSNIDRLIGEHQSKGEIQIFEGSHATFDVLISEVKDPLGQIMGRIITFHDTTEKAELLTKLQDAVDYDHLTGALSRQHFMELVQAELDKLHSGDNRVISLVVADLDDFKKINDDYGHHIGDFALVKATRTFNHLLRTQDVLGRIGGDEFAMLFIDTDGEHTWRIAQRLRKEMIRVPLTKQHKKIHLSASFGITTVEGGEVSLEELFIRADQAMYQAKHLGGNRVVRFEFI